MQHYAKWFLKVADKAREIMCMPQGECNWRVSAILVSLVKSEKNLSYWGLAKHFDKHSGDLERYELPRTYNRSLYQLRVSEIESKVQ